MLELYGDQAKLKAAIYDAWQRVRSVLAVLPTGGGKTVVFSDIIHDHTGASAAIVHRKEIVGQISLSLAALDVKHRIVAPSSVVKRIRRKHLRKFGKSFVDPGAQAGVVSVQTLTSPGADKNVDLQRWVNQVTLAVYDEGHHYVASGLWGRAVEMMGKARLLFVTATPERADGKGLGVHADGYAEEMVEGPSTRWLIDHGRLSPFTYKAPDTDLDVHGLAVGKNGDFNAKALRARVVESHLVGDVVKHYRKFADGQQTIVFADSVATAEEMARAFRADGIRAAALSAKTDEGVRDNTIGQFEAAELQVLINVDLFDEGFDVPAVECAILARPTESLAKFLQMVGRALRYVEGKTATIIDPVRNWERHGLPDWPRNWTLSGREKRSRKKDDTVLQRICAECTQPYPAYLKPCPYCGTPYTIEAGHRSSPEQVDGDLYELDVEALAALFAKINAADMPDDEYAADQIARNIPAIGRGADMKRHQAGKYRRKVLHNLVGWWVGMQPADRPMAEKHRRFFHRFGIDIAQAFTLNAAETDALCDKIANNFTKDIVT